jgi:outer membrane receptor for ferrienterochelin and colicin
VRQLLSLLVIAVLLVAPGYAQDEATLEELLFSEQVLAVTKTAQAVEEAPSIITVITREEIQVMGYRTLGEILRNVVGFGINDNGHWPDTGVRGINDRTTYGDKIQMLLDGHNMSWRQFNRNYYNPTWVPIDEIERIEIIRGPGAALWGAGALNGVVNIVTRSAAKVNGAEIDYGVDHIFASHSVSARLGRQVNEDLSYLASVMYYTDDADELLSPIREFDSLPEDTLELYDHPEKVEGDEESGYTLALKGTYKAFNISLHKSRHDTYAPLSTFSIVGGEDSRFITDRHIARLGYQKTFSPVLDFSAELSFDDYRFGDDTVYEDNPRGSDRFLRKMAASDTRYEGRTEAAYTPNEQLQGLLGVEFEYLDLVRWYYPEVWEEDQLEEPTFTNTHVGSYAQAQYSPSAIVGLTGGFRLDYDEIYGSVATPRAGVVFSLPSGVYVKGLFGSAYKAPSFHDLYYFRKNAYYGNPELDPEKSVTGEMQIGYKRAGLFDLRLTGFYTKINDLIGYSSRAATDPLIGQDEFPESQRPDGSKAYSQKVNLEYVTTTGVEVEAVVTPSDRVALRLNGTYREPKDADDEELNYAAKWTMGGGVTAKVSKQVQATLRGLGVGEKPVPARALSEPGYPNWATADDPTLEAPSYFIATLVLRARDVFRPGFNVSLKLDNITNQEWWDAGREVLYPQRKFQGMVWASLAL